MGSSHGELSRIALRLMTLNRIEEFSENLYARRELSDKFGHGNCVILRDSAKHLILRSVFKTQFAADL